MISINYTIDYIILRLHTSIEILDKLDLINRDMNMAKVYGIDYESVMTRGSQYRVEALLSKISKSTDHVVLSASLK
jgi:DNA polymerase zeta